MTNQRSTGGHWSSGVCALRFVPPTTIELSSHAKASAHSESYRLPSGIVVYAFRSGVFLFDCEKWAPGAPVYIPRVVVKGGEKIPKAYTDADKKAEIHVANRTQLMNCFLACLSTSISTVQKTAQQLGQEVSPTTYLPVAGDSERISDLTVKQLEQLLEEFPKQARLGGSTPLKQGTVEEACRLLDSILREEDVVQLVDLLYKGYFRYSLHDFSLAAVIAWAVCEKLLNVSWSRYLNDLRSADQQAIRMPRQRLQKLMGRDFSASTLTEFHELAGLLSFEMYNKLNQARQIRNAWMHNLESATDHDAANALQIAQELLKEIFSVELKIQLARSSQY